MAKKQSKQQGVSMKKVLMIVYHATMVIAVVTLALAAYSHSKVTDAQGLREFKSMIVQNSLASVDDFVVNPEANAAYIPQVDLKFTYSPIVSDLVYTTSNMDHRNEAFIMVHEQKQVVEAEYSNDEAKQCVMPFAIGIAVNNSDGMKLVDSITLGDGRVVSVLVNYGESCAEYQASQDAIDAIAALRTVSAY